MATGKYLSLEEARQQKKLDRFVARKWIQKAGTHREHFDICQSKRALAVEAGAIEITMRDAGRICNARRRALLEEGET